MTRAGALILLMATSLGCWQVRAGYCDHSHPQCGEGYQCDFPTQKCMPSTTGAGGTGGHPDGGHDAAADTGPPRCSADANTCHGTTPFCDPDSQTCRGCTSDQECANANATTLGCRMAAAGMPGVCVTCTKDAHCSTGDAPVCALDSNTCTGCTTDSDCQRFQPGVCRTFFAAAVDGAPAPAACLTPEQAIYVQNTTGCSDAPDAGSGGTATVPFCSMQPVLGAISKDRAVVIVTGSVAAGTWTYADQASGKLLIIGASTAQQPTALIASSGTPAFNMSSGDVTVRKLSFTSNLSMGIQAAGGMLTLDHVKVDSCKTGGILLNGAAFDIENSAVTNNGVGMDLTTSWSGIYVKTTPAGSKKLYSSTVAGNKNAGVLCAGAIDGRDVLAYANGGNVDVGSLCNFTSCGSTDAAAGATCGAQP